MRKHWTALLGALFVAPTVLQFIKWCWTAFKWGLDWIGRIEILASYSEKAGQIFEYLINPPASFFLLILGMGLIYLDVRRQGLPWAVQFAAVTTSSQAPTTGMAPDIREWFISHDIRSLANDEFLKQALEASEKCAEVERRYLLVHDEVEGLLASHRSLASGLSGAAAISHMFNEPEEVRSARSRLADIGAERSALARTRAMAFSRAVENVYEKLQRGTLVAKGFLVPLGEDPHEVHIPSARWRFLRFNGDYTEASGEA